MTRAVSSVSSILPNSPLGGREGCRGNFFSGREWRHWNRARLSDGKARGTESTREAPESRIDHSLRLYKNMNAGLFKKMDREVA